MGVAEPSKCKMFFSARSFFASACMIVGSFKICSNNSVVFLLGSGKMSLSKASFPDPNLSTNFYKALSKYACGKNNTLSVLEPCIGFLI